MVANASRCPGRRSQPAALVGRPDGLRAENVADQAELCLHVSGGNRDARPGGHAESAVITGSHDWTRLAVTAEVPGDADHIRFDFTLMGPGQVELRNAELTRG